MGQFWGTDRNLVAETQIATAPPAGLVVAHRRPTARRCAHDHDRDPVHPAHGLSVESPAQGVRVGQALFQIDASSPALAFDPFGRLLFVGSRNQLQVYDVEKMNVVAEYDVTGITSIAVSEDNRLIIWGDGDGAVHLWGRTAR